MRTPKFVKLFKRRLERFGDSHRLPPQISVPLAIGCFAIVLLVSYVSFFPSEFSTAVADLDISKNVAAVMPLDKAAYDRKMLTMANIPPPKVVGTSTIPVQTASSTPSLWPVKAAYPNAGAILPFKRIIAYYGNFYSKGMGVLGQYPEAEVIRKLKAEIASWEAADPATPVMPAIDYIAITAQASAGADGKYRFRMPASEIQKAIDLAAKVDGIVILEMQIGLSTLQKELPLLEPYLKLPQVHLALDPEFSMKTGAKPGTVIGTFSSADINYAANYLAKLVQDNKLPPKVLVVHRFTGPMVTGYKNITPLPEVQIVMDMDGWGSPAKKKGSYSRFVAAEPVQFTGFKLFYKNDLKPPSPALLTPKELLELQPQPIFIQYQ